VCQISIHSSQNIGPPYWILNEFYSFMNDVFNLFDLAFS
jgi:hypothetical protein